MIDVPSSEPRIVRFGAFELDLRSGELRKGGLQVSLQDQPLQVLGLLLERPGELVTREELRQRLWPADTYVDFEHGLNAAVKRLRDALGDSADSPRYIETLPRRGYRFIGPIHGDRTVIEARIRRRSMRRSFALATAALVVVVGAVVTWWGLRRPREGGAVAAEIPGPHAFKRITFGTGLDTDPTWSPDGRFIAYASDRSGNFDIWVQPVSGRNAVQLTHSPAADTQPTWSQDGSDIIVFRSERDGGGLFAVPAQGGPEWRLTTFGVRPRWSPSGSQVLFAAADIGFLGLYVVGLDGAPPTQVVKRFTDDVDWVHAWNWYADASRISLLGHHRGLGWGLYNVPLSGDTPVGVKLQNVMEFCQCPAWSAERHLFDWAPSGRTIFLACTHDLTMDVWRLAIDREGSAIVGSQRFTAGTGQALPVAVSPDGTRLAFTSRTMRIRLWTFPFDAAAGRITGNGEPLTDAGAYAMHCALTRDGRKLTYVLNRPGKTHDELWTADLKTRENRLVASDDQVRARPQWSPDGNYMAYGWWRPVAKTGVMEVSVVASRADGSEARLVTTPQTQTPDGRPALNPSDWSPDSEVLIGTSDVTQSPSFTYGLTLWPLKPAPHAESAVKVLATSKSYDLWESHFSPDGRWIAFEAVKRDGSGSAAVEVIPATGSAVAEGGWVLVTDPHDWCDKPRWSPDGRLIYFVRPNGPLWNLWGVRFDNIQGKPIGAPFQVTHFDTAARQISSAIGNPNIAISAKRLVLTIMERSGGIWTVDNADR